jgi:molybdopterin converting factor small subunit
VTVEVRLFATLARFLPHDSRHGAAVLAVPDGATIADVAAQLGIPPDFDHVALVNGREAGPADRLQPGDVVDLFPPLAGGADACSRRRGAG